ncbi:Probable diguanylate cyclase AdrA [Edwardsiella tarda]|nr:Probable diguanylate cyclase AdrA [Edwardsiella tarda]
MMDLFGDDRHRSMALYGDPAQPRRRFTRRRAWFLMLLGILMVAIASLHLAYLPHYALQRFNGFAFALELVDYLTVLLMLVAVQYSALDRPAYLCLTFGLSLWLLSGLLNLLDEIVVQPVLLGDLEDVLHSLGMLIGAWGGGYTLRYLARLRYLAMFDDLTALPNRRHFYSYLMSRPQPRQIGLLIIDLDHFKRVNDEFGHTVGDRVLFQFGRLLRAEFTHHAFPARIGGEEFAVILESEDRAWLEARAARLLQQASRVRITEQRGLTVSIGVGIYAAGETLAHFVARVDGALYQAKGAGRNHYRWSSAP